ncbi:LysE family translocator [Pseudonocardia halophobica]|nr:LysE family translocator [Pseudonocardia halophobica]
MSALLAFAGVAATLIMVPGPDWALVLGAGSRRGFVAPSVAGLAVGYVLTTAVVVAGVAPLVAVQPAALLLLTLVGAVYLLYVGVGMLRRPTTDAPPGTLAPRSVSLGRAVRQGAGVSALNPKSLLFFLAFLPQFADPGGPWPFAVQLAVLGGTWILLASMFYAFLGYTAQRSLHRRPTPARILTRISGAAMILAALVLPLEQLVLHIAHT